MVCILGSGRFEEMRRLGGIGAFEGNGESLQGTRLRIDYSMFLFGDFGFILSGF